MSIAKKTGMVNRYSFPQNEKLITILLSVEMKVSASGGAVYVKQVDIVELIDQNIPLHRDFHKGG